MTPRPVNLPQYVQRQLDQSPAGRVVIAAVLTVTNEQADSFRDIGLSLNGGQIVPGDPAPPPASCGKYAKRNLNGWTEKRKDLPKELREVSSWVPSWNSGSSHLVSREIEAWPLEHHAAKLLTLSATVLEDLVDGALVRFRVDQPLDRCSQAFTADLLFNFRLLREAVGEAHIFDADLSDDEYARIQRVDWELLPPGSGERVIERLISCNPRNSERLKVAGERLRVLDRLGHDGFIVGVGKFARYFGVKFGDRLVALERLEYGNALYIFEENWEQLTQFSRTELIKRRDPAVHRRPHLPGWPSAVRKIVQRDIALCR